MTLGGIPKQEDGVGEKVTANKGSAEMTEERMAELSNKFDINTNEIDESTKTLEYNLADYSKEMEPRNVELQENIGKQRGIINSWINDIDRDNEMLKNPNLDEESKKMWKNELIRHSNFLDAARRELGEYKRQLIENTKKIETFDGRKDKASSNIEVAKNELSSLTRSLEALKLEHKNAVSEANFAKSAGKNSYNQEREVANLYSEIQKTNLLISRAEQELATLEFEHERSFTFKK